MYYGILNHLPYGVRVNGGLVLLYEKLRVLYFCQVIWFLCCGALKMLTKGSIWFICVNRRCHHLDEKLRVFCMFLFLGFYSNLYSHVMPLLHVFLLPFQLFYWLVHFLLSYRNKFVVVVGFSKLMYFFSIWPFIHRIR